MCPTISSHTHTHTDGPSAYNIFGVVRNRVGLDPREPQVQVGGPGIGRVGRVGWDGVLQPTEQVTEEGPRVMCQQ